MSLIRDVRHELERLETSRKKLRLFGLIVGGVFLAMSAWLYFRGQPATAAVIAGGVGTVLVLGGALAPGLLLRVYRVWMAFAFVMGWLVSRVLLTLIFFLVLLPSGLLARACGKDFLDLRNPPEKDSHWVRRTAERTVDYEKMH